MAETEEPKYDKPYYEKIDFIYGIVSEKFSRLTESDNIFNNKVGFVIAGLIPLIAFYLSLADKINQLVLTIGIGISLVASILLLLALHVQNFYDPPKMEELLSSNSFEKDIFDLKNDFATKIAGDYAINKKTLKIKGIAYIIAIWMIIISLIVVCSGFVYNGIHGQDHQTKQTQTITSSHSHKAKWRYNH